MEFITANEAMNIAEGFNARNEIIAFETLKFNAKQDIERACTNGYRICVTTYNPLLISPKTLQKFRDFLAENGYKSEPGKINCTLYIEW